jgi:hypothetical protein
MKHIHFNVSFMLQTQRVSLPKAKLDRKVIQI